MYRGIYLIILILFCYQTNLQAQQQLFSVSDTLHKKRLYTVAASWTAIYGTALVGLKTAWYDNYERTSFHFYDDSKEWLQMDKAGHLFTNYFEAKWTANALQWAGVKHRNAALIGTATGLLFQTTLEILDGYSAAWGFSPMDMAANTSGALIFFSQEMLWKEQRIQVKFSTAFYQPDVQATNCNCDVSQRTKNLFGKTLAEQTLKNYNKQTYWLAANLHSFLPQSDIPEWLSIAVGYGADGMLGGFENKWRSNDDLIVAYSIPRVRQYYLSPDIDFTKIKTHSPLLKTLFTMMNVIKMPMPALMFNSEKQLRFFPVYF